MKAATFQLYIFAAMDIFNEIRMHFYIAILANTMIKR